MWDVSVLTMLKRHPNQILFETNNKLRILGCKCWDVVMLHADKIHLCLWPLIVKIQSYYVSSFLVYPVQIVTILLPVGLPTEVWSANIYKHTHTHMHTYTHSRGGPMGLETGSGQIYPSQCQNCDLSTPGSVATDVSGQNEKGTGDKSWNSISIVSLRASFQHEHFFTFCHNGGCLLAVWNSALSIFSACPTDACLSGIPCLLCVQMLPEQWGLKVMTPAFFFFFKSQDSLLVNRSNTCRHGHAVMSCLHKFSHILASFLNQCIKQYQRNIWLFELCCFLDILKDICYKM